MEKYSVHVNGVQSVTEQETKCYFKFQAPVQIATEWKYLLQHSKTGTFKTLGKMLYSEHDDDGPFFGYKKNREIAFWITVALKLYNKWWMKV